VKRPITPLLAAPLVAVALATPAFALESKVDRSRPPVPEEPSPWHPDAPVDFTLDNGLRVRFFERHQVPLVDVILQLRAGAAHDPQGLPGTAAWTLDLLDEGAGDKDALALSDAVDFLGAELSTSAGWEGSQVSLHVPSARFDDALGLMADVILRPAFADSEWQKKRKQAETNFLQWRDSPWALSQLARDRALYGDHRYGKPRSGTPDSLAKVKLDDLKAWWKKQAGPDNGILIVVGDTTQSALKALLNKHLGAWQKVNPAPRAVTRPAPIAGREVILVDKSGAAQSVIAAVARAPDGLRPLDAENSVLNTLLGGSFTSRLNQNLRERNQYSYGARSTFEVRGDAAQLLAYSAVATPVTAPALRELMNELMRARSYVEDSEALRARRYAALTYPGSFETGRATAGFWAWAHVKGLSDDEVRGFPQRALRVGHRDMLEAALRNVDTTNMRFVVVGDARKIRPALKRLLGFGEIRDLYITDLLGPAPGR
jgi:predicted Zn-dependent peptidase